VFVGLFGVLKLAFHLLPRQPVVAEAGLLLRENEQQHRLHYSSAFVNHHNASLVASYESRKVKRLIRQVFKSLARLGFCKGIAESQQINYGLVAVDGEATNNLAFLTLTWRISITFRLLFQNDRPFEHGVTHQSPV
jgi:hypothetical protein